MGRAGRVVEVTTVTVTVNVTIPCGAESHDGSKNEQSEGEGEEGKRRQHWRGWEEPQLGNECGVEGKRGGQRWWREVRQPGRELGLECLQLECETSNNGRELLTSLTSVRWSSRRTRGLHMGNMWGWLWRVWDGRRNWRRRCAARPGWT